ncbi:MAG: Grx4 family monothiol glutaredoxin [Nanoarchaeota archaeon]|nr:Grx4 family monothiol glutaredoxin [Nanoarchaeota archaeon]
MNPILQQNIEKLIQSQKVFLFIKGTPENPACGFSLRAVQILHSLNIKFGSFDVFSDESMRQGVKEYANWPTFPQLYVEGKLIGGCDIIEEMASTGELQKLLANQKK